MIPMIDTQISAFNESIVLSDSVLGISLDKYMVKTIRFTSVSITTISGVLCVLTGRSRLFGVLSDEPVSFSDGLLPYITRCNDALW